MQPRPEERLDNFRLETCRLGSGWAAVLLVDVTTEDGTYTDVQQTGLGRYATREEAEVEARQWAEVEDIAYEGKSQ